MSLPAWTYIKKKSASKASFHSLSAMVTLPKLSFCFVFVSENKLINKTKEKKKRERLKQTNKTNAEQSRNHLRIH